MVLPGNTTAAFFACTFYLKESLGHAHEGSLQFPEKLQFAVCRLQFAET
jgi:hypothetical protein